VVRAPGSIDVKLKRLGRTELQVSEVCLGTMPFGNRVDEPAACAIMDVAYAAGVRFFDTADVYPPPSTPDLRGRSEQIVGSWLKRRGLRAHVVLATKVGKPMGSAGMAGLSRTCIRRACDESLRRLQTDWIDLYLAHLPDDATPVDETVSALHVRPREVGVRRVWAVCDRAPYASHLVGRYDHLCATRRTAVMVTRPAGGVRQRHIGIEYRRGVGGPDRHRS
jgi:aryl-alcohol dehydrogenase-like predicted oxidoreductase